MKWLSGRRSAFFGTIVLALVITTAALAQFASKPGDSVGTVGGACTSSSVNYGWPDPNGHTIQCVSNVWTAVTQTGSPASPSGSVQFNNGGALGGSANLFWNNSSNYLGIGTNVPGNTLDVNGAVSIGYPDVTAPSNGLIVSGQVGIGSAAPTANLDIEGSLAVGAQASSTTTTTLNGTINSSVTTITVVSTANYPSVGAISINGSNEVMTYTGTTGTTFTGVTRGAYGTTATSHTTGASVFGMILQVQPGNVGGLYSSALTVFNNGAMIIGTPQQPYGTGGGIAIGTNVGLGGFVAIGSGAVASGPGSMAAGTNVTASGTNSFAFGVGTVAAAYYEQVVGQYNKTTGSENGTSFVLTDPAFVIGIGTTSSNLANALMVFHNGQMLVDGGTTVAIPAGNASLTAMGTTSNSTAAALNATNLSGTSLLYVRNDGNVGIGTTAPANALDVNGASAVGSFVGNAAPSGGMIVSGNVGIGSSSPVVSLDVAGALNVGSNLGNSTITTNGSVTIGTTTIVVNSTTSAPSLGILTFSGSSEVASYTGKTATTFTGVTRGVYGTTAATHGGSVPVGAALLQVGPASTGSAYTSGLTVFSNESLYIGTPGTYGSGGSLGIGVNVSATNVNDLVVGYNATASQSNSVAIGSSVTAGGAASQAFGFNTTSAAFAEMVIGQYNKATGSENAGTWTAGSTANPVFVVGIGTSGQSANAVMVFESGQMLVDGGTTVAIPAGTASLTAMGPTTDNTAAALNATNSSGTSLLYVRNDGNVGLSNTAPAYLLHVGSASASGVVAELQNSSGACTLQPGSSSMTTTCSSDIRLKTNVNDTYVTLPWVSRIHIRDFTVRATGERKTGVIAQELRVTDPDMVHTTPDGFYAVDAPNPWKLVKALQELNTVDDRLQSDLSKLKAANDNDTAEITALRARIEALEARR